MSSNLDLSGGMIAGYAIIPRGYKVADMIRPYVTRV
jgi:hypothetical protein